MTHNEIKQKLFALYDGPLTEKERALSEKHFAQCEECRLAVEDWKREAAILFPKPSFSEVEEDRFTASVMGRIRPLPVPYRDTLSSSWKWSLPLLGSAAAAIWVVFSLLPTTPYTPANTTVENFLIGDSPEVMGASWTNVPETAPSFQTIQVAYSGR